MNTYTHTHTQKHPLARDYSRRGLMVYFSCDCLGFEFWFIRGLHPLERTVPHLRQERSRTMSAKIARMGWVAHHAGKRPARMARPGTQRIIGPCDVPVVWGTCATPVRPSCPSLSNPSTSVCPSALPSSLRSFVRCTRSVPVWRSLVWPEIAFKLNTR